MSRAFVKETDEVPELPDRPISPHANLVTARGLSMIEAEVARHEAALAEAQAAEDREGVSAAQRELRYWTQRRVTAEVQPAPADCDVVRFGCRVTIARDAPNSRGKREQSYVIVGEDEADPAAGSLSYAAPLARALMGKGVGDIVTVGQGEAEVIRIEAPKA
jgi:transcription elongation GreA/GreB family factor